MELEKILEEIDNLYVDETDFGIECNMENRSDIACDNCYECIKEACKNIIRKHMNDGWIPVEDERRPEVGENVLGTNKYDEVLVYHYGWNSPHTRKMFFHLCGAAADIIAWRTLPEPYRPEVTKP